MSLLQEFGITDRGLVERALRCCRPQIGKPLWRVVMDRFGLGSTAARTLCLAFERDPDETHRRSR